MNSTKRLSHLIKRALCLLASVCWFGIAIGFGVVLVQYLLNGAGVQFFGYVISSASVLLGVVHVTGFAFAMLLSFVISVWLAAVGTAREIEQADGKRSEIP